MIEDKGRRDTSWDRELGIIWEGVLMDASFVRWQSRLRKSDGSIVRS